MKTTACVFGGVLAAMLVRPVVVMALAEVNGRRQAKQLQQEHYSRFSWANYLGLV